MKRLSNYGKSQYGDLDIENPSSVDFGYPPCLQKRDPIIASDSITAPPAVRKAYPPPPGRFS